MNDRARLVVERVLDRSVVTSARGQGPLKLLTSQNHRGAWVYQSSLGDGVARAAPLHLVPGNTPIHRRADAVSTAGLVERAARRRGGNLHRGVDRPTLRGPARARHADAARAVADDAGDVEPVATHVEGGALHAQRLLLELHPVMDEALDATKDFAANDAASTASLFDLTQSAHDRLYSRLFQSWEEHHEP